MSVQTEFLNRWNEVTSILGGLESRRRNIDKELHEISSQMRKDDNEIVEELLSGKTNDNSFLKSKLNNLRDEQQAIEEKIQIIYKKGGRDYLYANDQTLKELADQFTKEVMQQAKADEKKRLELEKRYDKLVAELMALDNERLEFNEMQKSRNQLASKIRKAKTDFPQFDFAKCYEFKDVSLYAHLGGINDRYRFPHLFKK